MTQKKLSKNTSGLKDYAEKKNQETIEKVNKAIDKLKRSKTKAINFKTVAEEAGVSKATLYNNDVLKERISGLRAIVKGVSDGSVVVAPPKDKVKAKAKEDKIKLLYEEIKKLKDEKKKLIVQLVEMEELKDEIRRLKEQIARLKK